MNDVKQRIKWFFPINVQAKATAEMTKKTIENIRKQRKNERPQNERTNKNFKQTTITCCRPQGG